MKNFLEKCFCFNILLKLPFSKITFWIKELNYFTWKLRKKIDQLVSYKKKKYLFFGVI